MENKRRVKLYKAGKLWCAMALTTVALVVGMTMMPKQIQADTTVKTANEHTTAVSNPNNQQSAKADDANKQQVVIDQNDHGNYAWMDHQEINNQGQLNASGWHATNESAGKDYHFIIAYDQTNHCEIARHQIAGTNQQVKRDDIARIKHVAGAGQSGFNVSFDLSRVIANTSVIQLISRYSSDVSGNSDYIDYCFAPISVNHDNVASLDSAKVVDGKLYFSGWHASNLAANKTNRFLIIFDRTLGREVARRQVMQSVSRPDVAQACPGIIDAGQSGFDVEFDLAGLDFNHQLQLISRYSASTDGNSNYLDYWYASFNNGSYDNYAYLDSRDLSDPQHVTFKGWHVNDISRFAKNHFLILFDNTAHLQVAVTQTVNSQRTDIAKVFQQIAMAGNAGFSGSFDLINTPLVAGHTYSLVSRYSTSSEENGGEGSYADYWFAPFTLGQHSSYLDDIQMTDQGLKISGWMVSDDSGSKQYAYAIVMNDGREVNRQQLTLTNRSDIASIFSHVYNSLHSGFSTVVKVNPAAITGNMQIILRFTDDKAGNGYTDDQTSRNYGSNEGYFDQANFDGRQVHVAGWHASNQSADKPYEWLIAVDQNGSELGRWEVTNKKLSRPDLAKNVGYILNSDHSGFNLNFAVNDRMQHKVIRLIDRLTDDPNGNGNYVDYYSNGVSINSGAQTTGAKTLYYDAMGNIVGAFNNAEVICQNPELPTGCEMTAVTMMLRYAGVNINKFQVADETPRSSNGDNGFVGNPYSVTGWWVFPTGIAPVVQHHLGTSQVMTGASLAAIQEKLNIGHLVVVWVANMNGFVNHAITITGYNASGFFYNNPWTGRKEAMSYGEFYGHWNADAQRALSY